MRRAFAVLLLVLVVATLGLAGCSSYYTGHHWPGSGDRWVAVRVDPALAGDPGFGTAVWQGSLPWSNRSPYVYFDVQYGPCSDPEPCVEVHRQPMNGAATQWSLDSNSHIHHVWMWFDSGSWDYGTLVAAVCHELGHALGLVHGDAPGPCPGGTPSDVDLLNIATAYNHAD